MLIIGTMWARGEGSTLKNKNKRKICGMPMVHWALKNATDAGFIDEIFVITEDQEIADTARQLNCRVIERPREMLFYYGGFLEHTEWTKYVNEKKKAILKAEPDISVGLNCNICLLEGETLRQMYVKLMEDELASSIFPVVEVEPHLYMINSETGYLFPIWDDTGLDRQRFPKLYRRIGVAITHNKRLVEIVYNRNLHHVISRKESIDIHSEDDLKIAEMFLKERLDQTHSHASSGRHADKKR